MMGGTTNNYVTGKVCTWHLVGASQYSMFKTLKLNITSSYNNDTKANENYVKLYVGSSFEDIIRNGSLRAKDFTSANNVYYLPADSHIMIISEAMSDVANFNYTYEMVETY